MTRISRRQFLSGIVLLAGAGAGASLLAACSSASAAPPVATSAAAGASAQATTAPAPPTEAPQAVSEKTTVEMWMMHPEWKDAMTAVVAAFQKTNPNVDLKITYT